MASGRDRDTGEPAARADGRRADGVRRHGGGTAPAVVRLQRAAGNRVVSRMVLARAAAGAGGAQAVRTIVLDGNVFDQLARGNVEAADALVKLARTEKVYVSWQGFDEWAIKPTDRKQVDAVKRIIDRLELKMAPPAPKAVLDDLVAKNSYKLGNRTATILSDAKDLKVAADAKALGAEVWSFDGAFTNGAVEKKLGVKVAAETRTIRFVRGQADQSRALRLVGIAEEPVVGQLPAGRGVQPPEPGAGDGGGAGRVADEPTVVAERAGEDAAADLAEKAAGKAAQGLTFAEIGAALEVIGPILDALFLAEAGYAIGKMLIFHNPAEMDPDQEKLTQLMDAKVMPAAMKELAGHEREAKELALHDDERDVYARVTMAITYTSSRTVAKFPGPFRDEHIEDAAFDSVTVGYDDRAGKGQKGGERYERDGGTEYRHRTELVTFSILLNPLGRSRGLRRWVALRANASHAIAQGYSARFIAEGTHWIGEHMGPGGYDWTYLDDREEARRRKAMGPSHRAEVELEARIAFTEAYIDAASDHIEQLAVKKLYDDAVQYYDELKGTTIDPIFGPVTKEPKLQGFPLKQR